MDTDVSEAVSMSTKVANIETQCQQSCQQGVFDGEYIDNWARIAIERRGRLWINLGFFTAFGLC